MPSTGTLANGTLTNNLETNVFSIPADQTNGYAVVSIMMMNMGTTDANCRMALHEGTRTDGDFIEYDFPVVPKGMIERTGVVVGPGQAISLWTTNSSEVTFRINGTEINVDRIV